MARATRTRAANELSRHQEGRLHVPGRRWSPRIDWAIDEGEFHCLVGRSGCGKTTLLKLAAGLLHPDEGPIALQGGCARAGPRLGFGFQAPTLLEWHPVLDNVLLPVSLKHRATATDERPSDC